MSDRRRRKSLSIFRPALSSLTPIQDNKDQVDQSRTTFASLQLLILPSQPPDSAPASLKKRHTDSFADPPSPSPSATSATSNLDRTDSKTSVEKLLGKAAARPRSLQKPRPSSIFGCVFLSIFCFVKAYLPLGMYNRIILLKVQRFIARFVHCTRYKMRTRKTQRVRHQRRRRHSNCSALVMSPSRQWKDAYYTMERYS